MAPSVPMAEVWRGPLLESLHLGDAAICDAQGQIRMAWGNPGKIILPRSSCKMLQALPLIESGAAKSAGLNTAHLALACSSHNGAAIHTDPVQAWLSHLGLTDDDLRCGPQMPDDSATRTSLIKTDQSPCQCHNNCSGKHAGFLTYTKHMGAGPDYVAIDHPLQIAVKDAFEEMTGENSSGFGIDGCAAPNFATSLQGLALSMAKFAAATANASAHREHACHSLVKAMLRHPELVAGEGRACTELMRAMNGKTVVKTGAEGVFIAILPDQGLGVAVKIADGATRAAECAIAAILVKLGALDPNYPAAKKRLSPPILNRRRMTVGHIQAATALL